jgi:hypothetical protein
LALDHARWKTSGIERESDRLMHVEYELVAAGKIANGPLLEQTVEIAANSGAVTAELARVDADPHVSPRLVPRGAP